MKKAVWIIVIIVVALCGFGLVQMRGMQAKMAEAQKAKTANTTKVARKDIVNKVIETGTIDAVKSVEVKSRVSGRVKKLFVDEGDQVVAGQLLAIIDPRETQLQVEQGQAQLRGAQANVARTSIQISQQRINSAAALQQALARLAQVKAELGIQPTLTNATVRTAASAVETAKNEVRRLETTSQPNARSADLASLKEAQSNYDTALSDYNRQSELLRDGYVSTKIVENSRNSLTVAEARLLQAKDAHDRLENQLRLELARANDSLRSAQADYDKAVANRIQNDIKRREYESAVADVNKARAGMQEVSSLVQSKISSQASVDQLSSQLADAQRNLGETEIRAPIAGIVTQRLIQEGELATGLSSFSSGTTLVKLEDRKALRVRLNINEIDTAKLATGMNANVTVDALPNETFLGEVKKIAPSSVGQETTTVASSTVNNETVVKYEVEIWLLTSSEKLRSGMSAKCELNVQSAKNVLTVPQEFVETDKLTSKTYVYLQGAKPTDKPVKTEVKIGIKSGSDTQLLSGVKEGDVLARPDLHTPPQQGMFSGPED